MAIIIYIMGVSGAGKTTVGQLLSQRTGIPFFDGDDYHSEANRNKMEQSIPLNDDDRRGWLVELNELAKTKEEQEGAIIACSALKEKYRQILSDGLRHCEFIYLEGSFDLIMDRLEKRKGHYMPPALLQSQFDALESPSVSNAYDVSNSAAEIVTQVQLDLKLFPRLGLIGLGVMGLSLARNAASKGISLSLYNREVKGSEESVALKAVQGYSELNDSEPFNELEPFVQSLSSPAVIFLMISAGPAVDAVTNQLLPLLKKGDIIIDGGNSFYKDTELRIKKCSEHEVQFVGSGVSGGEEGALLGPSIMPGGNYDAVEFVLPLLKAIAAKNKWNQPCCINAGNGGAGHFVKMVHNGIEYAEMQLLAECYALLKHGSGLPQTDITDVFTKMQAGNNNSYLLGITIEILKAKDGDGSFLIDGILPVAASKGTGKWCVQTAADIGVASTMLTQALFERYVSESVYNFNSKERFGKAFLIDAETLNNAMYVARIINHLQGFTLIRKASELYKYDVDCKRLAATWCNGCIIRSDLMEHFALGELNFSEEEFFGSTQFREQIKFLQTMIAETISSGFAMPLFSNALQYALSFLSGNGVSLIQAQRDFFGAHGVILKNDEDSRLVNLKW